MHRYLVIGLGMLLGLSLGCSSKNADTASGGQAEATSAITSAWGEEVEGLRMRVTAPKGTEFSSTAGLPLRIEIKNVGKEPVDYRRMALVAEIQAHRPQDETVRLEVADRPPINADEGGLEPGEILSWIVGLERAACPRSWKAGESLQLVVRFMVRGRGHDSKTTRPLFFLSSPPLTVKLLHDFPATLKTGELPEKWLSAATLIYHERGIWWGSTWLRVDGEGRALLIRSRFGHRDKDISPGVYKAALSKEQLGLLASLLRKHEFKIRRETPPPIDVGETTLVLSVGGAAARSGFHEPAEKREPALVHLRAEMRKLLVAVAKSRESAIDGASAGFDRLTMGMTSTWPHNRTITISPDGTYRFEMQVLEKVPGEERWVGAKQPYVATYRLSAAHLEQLERLLPSTGWLSDEANVNEALVDAIRYTMTVTRDGRTTQAICYGNQDAPYENLIRFLRGINQQEWLLYKLRPSGKDVGLWLHVLDGQLKGMLGEHSIRPYAPALDYGRLLPALERIRESEEGERLKLAREAIRRIKSLSDRQAQVNSAAPGQAVEGGQHK